VLRDTGDELAEAWATVSLGATYIGDSEGYEEGDLNLVRLGIGLAERAQSPVLVRSWLNVVEELNMVHGDDDAADDAYRGDYELALRHGRAALEIHRRFGHHYPMPWASIAVAGHSANSANPRMPRCCSALRTVLPGACCSKRCLVTCRRTSVSGAESARRRATTFPIGTPGVGHVPRRSPQSPGSG